ncbi:hypothetical protein STENM327S_01867 [Streptomyces tendae]
MPGDTETVRGLEKKLSGCAKVLQEAYDLVTKLLDGSCWKGDAAVAFREQLDGGPLPLNLRNAAHSVRKAARQLDRWKALSCTNPSATDTQEAGGRREAGPGRARPCRRGALTRPNPDPRMPKRCAKLSHRYSKPRPVNWCVSGSFVRQR